VQPLEQLLDHVKLDVRDRDVGRGQLRAQDVGLGDVDGDAVLASRLTSDLDRNLVEVHRQDRREPESDSRNGDDARTAARVEQAPALEP
jgi:hypothetical protein